MTTATSTAVATVPDASVEPAARLQSELSDREICLGSPSPTVTGLDLALKVKNYTKSERETLVKEDNLSLVKSLSQLSKVKLFGFICLQEAHINEMNFELDKLRAEVRVFQRSSERVVDRSEIPVLEVTTETITQQITNVETTDGHSDDRVDDSQVNWLTELNNHSSIATVSNRLSGTEDVTNAIPMFEETEDVMEEHEDEVAYAQLRSRGTVDASILGKRQRPEESTPSQRRKRTKTTKPDTQPKSPVAPTPLNPSVRSLALNFDLDRLNKIERQSRAQALKYEQQQEAKKKRRAVAARKGTDIASLTEDLNTSANTVDTENVVPQLSDSQGSSSQVRSPL